VLTVKNYDSSFLKACALHPPKFNNLLYFQVLMKKMRHVGIIYNLAGLFDQKLSAARDRTSVAGHPSVINDMDQVP
jgi:hypothetical protein